MYWLILLLILFPLNLFAGFSVSGVTDPASVAGVAEPASVAGVASDYSEACSSSTDDVLVDASFVASYTSGNQMWTCSKLTTTATWDVTGVMVGMCDDGSNAGNFTVGIYAHDATYDEPDADGTPIATKSIAASAVTNCGDSSGQIEVVFDSLVTDIGATTVWVCVTEASSSVSRGVDNTSGRICHSATGTPANNSNWTCYDANTYNDSILGCE